MVGLGPKALRHLEQKLFCSLFISFHLLHFKIKMFPLQLHSTSLLLFLPFKPIPVMGVVILQETVQIHFHCHHYLGFSALSSAMYCKN